MRPAKLLQVELPAVAVKEALVEKPVKPLGHRAFQRLEQIEVDALEVACGEAAEEDIVPHEAGERQLRLPVDLAPTQRGVPVVERHVVEDVKLFIHPAPLLATPPSVFVVERYAHPTVERSLQAFVGFTLVAPAQHLNQAIASEVDPVVGKVLKFGKLDEAQKHLVIVGGGQSMLIRTGDGELAGDHLAAVLVVNTILEDHRLLIRLETVGDGAERELGEIHLILAVRNPGQRRIIR